MNGSGRRRGSKWDMKDDVSPENRRDIARSNKTGSSFHEHESRDYMSGGRGLRRDDRMNEDSTLGGGQYTRRMPQGPDGQRPQSRSRSPRRSRGKSYRSRSRSRSRSPAYNLQREPGVLRSGSKSGHSAPLCRNFTAGRCNKGDICRFSHHSSPSHDTMRHFESKNGDGWDRRRLNDGASRYQSEPYPGGRSIHICNEYLKGSCTRGASCKYRHHDSGSNEFAEGAIDVSHRDGVNDWRSKSGSSYDRDTRISSEPLCKYFAAGFCRNGKHCKFSHQRDVQYNSERSPDGRKPGHNSGGMNRGWNDQNWGDRNSLRRVPEASEWKREGSGFRDPQRSIAREWSKDGLLNHELGDPAYTGGTESSGNEKMANIESQSFQWKSSGNSISTTKTIEKGFSEGKILSPKGAYNSQTGLVGQRSDSHPFPQTSLSFGEQVTDQRVSAENHYLSGIMQPHISGDYSQPKPSFPVDTPGARNNGISHVNGNIVIPHGQGVHQGCQDGGLVAQSFSTVDSVQHIQPISTVDSVRHIQPISTVDSVRHIQPISIVDSVRHTQPISTVDSVRHTQPISTVDNVRDIQPISTVDHFGQIQATFPSHPAGEHMQIAHHQTVLDTNMVMAHHQPVLDTNMGMGQSQLMFPSLNQTQGGMQMPNHQPVIDSMPVLDTNMGMGQSQLMFPSLNQTHGGMRMPNHHPVIDSKPVLDTNMGMGQSQLMFPSLNQTQGGMQMPNHQPVIDSNPSDGAYVSTTGITQAAPGVDLIQNSLIMEKILQHQQLAASLDLLLSRPQLPQQLYDAAAAAMTQQTASLLPPVISAHAQPIQASEPARQYDVIGDSLETKVTERLVEQSSQLGASDVPSLNCNPTGGMMATGDPKLWPNGVEPQQKDHHSNVGPAVFCEENTEATDKGADETEEALDQGPTDDMGLDCGADEGKKSKDAKGVRPFKFALAEYVKDLLKPTWKGGQMNKEVYKTIVKKVVDKVTETVQPAQIPRTKDKIDQYLSASKPKLSKLVQAYLEKLNKTKPSS